MKPHVTLVNPAAPVGSAMHMPFALLGLGYLAAVLEKNNYKVDVIDCQVLKLSPEEFRTEISKLLPYERFMGLESTFERAGFRVVARRSDRRPIMRYILHDLPLVGGD